MSFLPRSHAPAWERTDFAALRREDERKSDGASCEPGRGAAESTFPRGTVGTRKIEACLERGRLGRTRRAGRPRSQQQKIPPMSTLFNSERPPAVNIMRHLGLEPDPWQREVLEADHPRLLLNCSRQAGKSTVVALLGLVEAVFVPDTRVLLVSRSLRQSAELFRIVTDFYRRLGSPLCERQTAEELCLKNFSRIVCLPCREETLRGYSRVSLLVIDEAARVPDDVYRAVRPMLAVSNGRII